MLIAVGLLEWMNGKFGDFAQTLQMGMMVLGVVMVIAAYIKSKALVPTLGAIVLAAIANVAAFAPGLLGNMFANETPTSTSIPETIK